MFFHKELAALTLILASLFVHPVVAQEPGTNISSYTGIVSNLSGGAPAIKYISVRVPEIGRTYEVKINFLKVEASAAALDAYIDYLNEQAKARGETTGSVKWDELRGRLMQVVSKADFEVFDMAGNSIGRASDLGTTTFFRTVKFTAKSYDYKIKLRCTAGAGAFHATLEWD